MQALQVQEYAEQLRTYAGMNTPRLLYHQHLASAQVDLGATVGLDNVDLIIW